MNMTKALILLLTITTPIFFYFLIPRTFSAALIMTAIAVAIFFPVISGSRAKKKTDESHSHGFDETVFYSKPNDPPPYKEVPKMPRKKQNKPQNRLQPLQIADEHKISIPTSSAQEPLETPLIKSDKSQIKSDKSQKVPQHLQIKDGVNLSRRETEEACPVNGIEKKFFKNGKVKSETPYKDKKKDGTEKYYFENGKLRLAACYKGDIRVGAEKEYNEDGQLIRQTTYKDGKKQGIEKLCHPNGRLKRIVNYGKNGGKEGEARFYDENAKIIAEVVYSGDIPVSGFKADKKSGGKIALTPEELAEY